jgi:short-subunit dehydrogenase
VQCRAYSADMTAIDFSQQTTIVTGASSGIGAAFARELARRGSNLVLVARRLDRLQTLASELQTAHSIRVPPIALDLSAPGAGRSLAAEIADRGLTVTGLVNNAGFGTDGAFHDEDPARLTDEINVDVANLVDITRAFIEPMVYSACKAFVLSFTEALWFEARGTGLRVLCLSPGLTRTEFFDALDGGAYNGSYQTPEQVVQTAMRVLDRGGRRPSVQSGRMNALTTMLPRFFTRKRLTVMSGVVGARAAGREPAKVG